MKIRRIIGHVLLFLIVIKIVSYDLRPIIYSFSNNDVGFALGIIFGDILLILVALWIKGKPDKKSRGIKETLLETITGKRQKEMIRS